MTRRALVPLALAAALLATPPSNPAHAGDTPPVSAGGEVVGRVVGPAGAGVARARVALFDAKWNYLRDVRARGTGRFAFSGLEQGRYRLQVTDGRAAWRTDRLALTDAVVRISPDATSIAVVRMRKGGFLTGRVSRGPKRVDAARALVRAADESGRGFEVRADSRGRFALGGLPPGNYRVWAYDRARRWVGPTTAVRGLKRHQGHDLGLTLPRRAGGVNGHVFADGQLVNSTIWITATHRRTGQWWSVRVRNGDLSLRGLAPGRYDLRVEATDQFEGHTFRPAWKVRSGHTRHTTLRLEPRVQSGSGRTPDTPGDSSPAD